MKTKNKIGRPSKFNSDVSEKIMGLARNGKTDKEMSETVGVCEKTLNNWKLQNPDFLQSLKENKEVADSLVEAALFENAIKGNVTAQIFWLKNRRSSEWRYSSQNTDDVSSDKPHITLIIPNNNRGPIKDRE